MFANNVPIKCPLCKLQLTKFQIQFELGYVLSLGSWIMDLDKSFLFYKILCRHCNKICYSIVLIFIQYNICYDTCNSLSFCYIVD